jgi:hypothetical protein
MKVLRSLMLMLIIFAATVPASAEEGVVGHLTGKWISPKIGPMSGGVALVFKEASGPPPVPERYWRVPDYIGVIDANGSFSLELEEGNYYLGTVKRFKGSEMIGPPYEGDYYFFSKNERGVAKLYKVYSGKSTSAGTIKTVKSFKRVLAKEAEGLTTIEGSVAVEGTPVANVLVFAYLNSDMNGRPLFVSDKTGSDGKFTLRVDKGGDYYLKVRDTYGGGEPGVGAVMGFYGKESPLPVKVQSGTTQKGITIFCTRFAGRGNPNPN